MFKMYKIFLIISINVCLSQSLPQLNPQNFSTPTSTVKPIEIITNTEYFGPDGSFNYSFQTANGINVAQSGYFKHNNYTNDQNQNSNVSSKYREDILVIQGAYSYTAPDGLLVNITYVADQNGFQPEGDSIPKTSTYSTRSSSNLGVGDSSIKPTTTPIPIIPNPPNA
ncbi:endocuticle structural glycoprotein SgAbd-2-like [Chrysoperla carnea]|uniref:endocuticle structural glycoprotein SgAbd-2-like n=1 Tax=Chrysoperla carnea TaxID=189513 RepID=UPI001D069601|nr:endocuticle structural glycoprotein SgAbd-2-like [Chrysoperla carnea]